MSMEWDEIEQMLVMLSAEDQERIALEILERYQNAKGGAA